MTRKTLAKAAGLTIVAAAVASCGGGGGGGSVATTAPVVTTLRLEDNFGIAFGNDFRTVANTEPVKPATGDVVGLSLTTEPTPLH